MAQCLALTCAAHADSPAPRAGRAPPVPAQDGRLMAIRMRRPLLAAGLVLYFAAIRPWLLGWGATGQERRQPLPGDDLVPARWQTTRGNHHRCAI